MPQHARRIPDNAELFAIVKPRAVYGFMVLDGQVVAAAPIMERAGVIGWTLDQVQAHYGTEPRRVYPGRQGGDGERPPFLAGVPGGV
jgi:hypothetical protein